MPARHRHGGTGGRRRVNPHPLYSTWQSMVRRCHGSPDVRTWAAYGGRGISVCEEWRGSFVAFVAAVGPRPSPNHSLDRIDNNGNYEPGNVRWATRREQQGNRRATRTIELSGSRLRVADVARASGLDPTTIVTRLRNGWSANDAVSLPTVTTAGMRNHKAKLTDDLVKQIRARSGAGESAVALSQETGVDYSTIRRVVNRKSWRHIPG